MRHLLPPLVTFALLAGCTAGPDYAGPPEVVSADTGTRFVRAGSDVSASDPVVAQWWLLLGDPELTRLVEAALSLHGTACTNAFETLRRLGGREIAAMAGAVLAARYRRIPVMLDGFIGCAAIAPLAAEAPGIVDHCLAGHCSAENAHGRLLGALRLEPLLALDMRLGEGSGACLAVNVLRAALACHSGMATFAEAGVSEG